MIVRLEKYLGAQLDEPTRSRLLNQRFQVWLREQLQQVSVSSLESSRDLKHESIRELKF